jgi:hypothetical protein
MNKQIRIRKLPPVWFIRCLDAFRWGLIRLNRSLFPANVVLYEQFQAFWLLPCLKVAAELDIAGILKEGPKTAEEIAGLVRAHPGSLFRLLRALASQGIFRQKKDGTFINTTLSIPLAEGNNSVRSMILHHLGKVNWNLVGELSYSVKTGKEAFPLLYGKDVYSFLSEQPDEFSVFDRSMSDLSRISVDPLLNAFDFSGFRTIADIGGGEGLLLSFILAKNHAASGILLDLPDAAEKARITFRQQGIEDRTSIVEGSFFEIVPPEADCYILKNVLHNWGNEDCLKILRNIRKAIPVHGKLYIMEMIVGKGNKPSFSKLIDIQMMVMNKGAKERTLSEFSDLLAQAEFVPIRVIPTIAPVSVIECRRKETDV